MQDLVSTRWIRASGLAGSVAIALAMFAFSGSAGMARMCLVWAGVAMSGSMWMASRSTNRSARTLPAEREGELVPARALAPRVATARKLRSLMERN